MKQLKIQSIFLAILFIFYGCAENVRFRSFTDPSLQASSVNTVAILPIRNTRILPGESREMSRAFAREFVSKNKSIKIINSVESTDKINENDMADKYADFLRDYSVSGIPNARVLKEIGDMLEADAILQGEIFDLVQQDGSYPGKMARTSLTLRYSLLSTSRGDVLWEATASAHLKPGGLSTVFTPPPPIIDVIQLAQERVLKDIPYLGN